MLKKINYLQSFGLFLSVILMSCSLPINNTSTYDNDNKNLNTFKAKSVNRIEENDSNITYVGTWNTVSHANSSDGLYTQTSGELIDDADLLVSYHGEWQSNLNTDAYNNSFKESNSKTITEYNSTSQDLIYSHLTSWNDGYGRKYIESKPIIIDDKNDSVIYSGTNWNQNNFNHYSNANTNYIEIPFSGTNINILGSKNSNSGKINITIRKSSSGTIEKTVNDIDLYNSDEIKSDSIIKIQGLEDDNHIAKIEITNQKNASSNDYLFIFDKAVIYPSVQYKFSGTNIYYSALKDIKGGKVDIIIDNNSPERIDLYSPINNFNIVKEYNNLSSSEHIITIQGTDETNINSLGNIINFAKFITYPNLTTEISTITNYFDLSYIKNSNYGKADLVIFDKDAQGDYIKLDTAKINGVTQNIPYEIDMYNNTTVIEKLNISDLSSQNHAFSLVYKDQKNTNSSGTNINFDKLFIGSRASYNFYGKEINYIATTANNQGKVEIFIDNVSQGIYDLYSSTTEYQQSIFTKTFSSNGNHTIEIRQLDEKNSSSSALNINIDAFDVLIDSATISFGNVSTSIVKSLDIIGSNTVQPKNTETLTVKAYNNAGEEVLDSVSNDKWTWGISSAVNGYITYTGSDNTANFVSTGKEGSVDITACSKLTGLKKSITIDVPDIAPYIIGLSHIGSDLTLPTPTSMDTVTTINASTTTRGFWVKFKDLNDWIIASGCTCSGGTSLKVAYERNDPNISTNSTTFKNIPASQADNYDIYVGGFPIGATLKNYISSRNTIMSTTTNEDVTVTINLVGAESVPLPAGSKGYIIVNARQVNSLNQSVVTRRHRWNFN